MTEPRREAAKAASAARVEHIKGVFHRYAALMREGDADGMVALFAPDAVLRDPVDGPVRTGQAELRAWFEESFARNGGTIDMRLEGAIRVAGRYGAAALTAVAGDARRSIRVDTLDVMEFDDEGLVVRLDAYWGPSNIHPTQTT